MKRHCKTRKATGPAQRFTPGHCVPSSPADAAAISAGIAELRRIGFDVENPSRSSPWIFFHGHEERLQQFCRTVHDKKLDGVISLRGGYGSNYLIDFDLVTRLHGPK